LRRVRRRTPETVETAMKLASTAALRRTSVAAVIAAATAIAGPATAQNSGAELNGKLLKPYTATYSVTAQGNPFGTSTATLSQDGDAWVVKNLLESDMFGQTIEARVLSAGLAAVSYKFTMSGGMAASADIAVADGKITGNADGPEQMGGKRTFDVPAPPGVFLPGMHRIALSVLPLTIGQSISVPEFSFRSGVVENLTLKVASEEKLTVAAGSFDTYRIDVSGGDQGSTLWVTKDVPHMVVKQEMQAFPVAYELKSLQ
jgi:hypothetical protein